LCGQGNYTPIPSSVTVIKDSAHRYFLSFVVEVLPEALPKTDNSVGIDLGIKTFTTVVTLHATSLHSKKIDAPKPLKKRMLEVPKTK
jgi:putative transposase